LKKMKLNITHMLTRAHRPSTASSPGTWLFHWVQWSCQLPSGKPEKLPHQVHQVITKFMAVPHYT
jgi:hypothetical protein